MKVAVVDAARIGGGAEDETRRVVEIDRRRVVEADGDALAPGIDGDGIRLFAAARLDDGLAPKLRAWAVATNLAVESGGIEPPIRPKVRAVAAFAVILVRDDLTPDRR